MLEEMVISHMTEEEKSEYGDMEFVLSFGTDEIELGDLGDNAQEMTSDRFVVTDMYFERRLG